ncbi:hypothetical protein E2C01_061166 [Portunus trituberculatus]|uniref:Uncharacterized protein n=1 Tax=Portunus trituberculatus TaxID=210409 RepID=A0A5B7HAL9_PORTR|nr:hypothetical protein [Portunus trituberculatus]
MSSEKSTSLSKVILYAAPTSSQLPQPRQDSLTTAAAQERTGRDGNRHRDTSRRGFVDSKGKRGTNTHPDSQTYSERQGNRKHLALFL